MRMPNKVRARIVGFSALVLILGALAWWIMREPDSVAVVSWGGEYSYAQSMAMYHPYTDDSGVEVHQVLYGGGTADLEREAESPVPKWDVVDFELPDAAEACRKGLLEPINPALVPHGTDGAAAADDFVPGALGHCWIGSVVYSQVIAFDPARFVNGLPTRAADFFDLVKFPGGRGMKDAPKGNLELALLAAGVPPAEVYATLSTPEGVNRALYKLDTLRAVTRWWQSSDEALSMLADGSAFMTTALNGPVQNAIARHHRNIKVIWDRQRYELDVFGLVRGTPNKDDALAFIHFATGTMPLARISEMVPYGPARRSALAHIGEGQQGAVKTTAAMLPTAHFETAFPLDPDWWAMHGPAIDNRWKEWRAR